MAERRMAASVSAAMKMQRYYRRMKAKKEAMSQRRRALKDAEVAREQVEAARMSMPGVKAVRAVDEGVRDSNNDDGDRPSAWDSRWESFRRLRLSLRAIVEARSENGRTIIVIFNTVLLLNLLNTMVSTISEVHDVQAIEGLLEVVEVVCSIVFFTEYTMRTLAGGDLGHPLKAMRLFDLLCLLPSFLGMSYWIRGARWSRNHKGLSRAMEMIMLLRVIRILDFPYFRREVVMVFRGLRSAVPVLVVPAFLALYVWILSSSLFCWLEHVYDGPDKRFMPSIPEAMYWTSHFLIGEWVMIDFTQGAGNRVVILVVLFGAMIFSIPLGIIIESVQSSLRMELLEEDSLEDLRERMDAANAEADAAAERPEEERPKPPPVVAGGRFEDPRQGLQRRLRRAAVAAQMGKHLRDRSAQERETDGEEEADTSKEKQ